MVGSDQTAGVERMLTRRHRGGDDVLRGGANHDDDVDTVTADDIDCT